MRMGNGTVKKFACLILALAMVLPLAASAADEGQVAGNSINGLVWLDDNGDGLIDNNEQAVSDYPVYLYKSDNLETEVAGTKTDNNGLYSFSDIENGSYIVGIKQESQNIEYTLSTIGIIHDNKFALEDESNMQAFTNAFDVERNTQINDLNGSLNNYHKIEEPETSSQEVGECNAEDIPKEETTEEESPTGDSAEQEVLRSNIQVKEYNSKIKTSMVAEEVNGMVNTWDITTHIEETRDIHTADVVLVIDTSKSMSGSKLSAAKTAALNFINNLLGEGSATKGSIRIAVVTYANEATTVSNFINNAGQLTNSINGLAASGGTHTQAGIHLAQQLLNNTSTADKKYMVLLSDGLPTFSYGLSTTDYFKMQFDNNKYENITEVPQQFYKYDTTVGTGKRLRTQYETNSEYYYNHGNSAIAEAGYAKGSSTIYTIGLETEYPGTTILEAIATDGKAYSGDSGNLTGIYNEIADLIGGSIHNASINEPMGSGFEFDSNTVIKFSQGSATYDNNSNSIHWKIGKLEAPEPQIKGSTITCHAEMTYRVEINDDILNRQADGEGMYTTNGKSILNYISSAGNNTDAEITSPMVDPVLLIVQKLLYDADDTLVKDSDKDFTIHVKNKSTPGYDKEYLLKSGDRKVLTNLRDEDTYDVSETAVSDGSLNQYTTDIKIEGMDGAQFIAKQGMNDANILVTNKQKPETSILTINKQVEGKYANKDQKFDFEIKVDSNSNGIHSYTKYNADNSKTHGTITFTAGIITAIGNDQRNTTLKLQHGEHIEIELPISYCGEVTEVECGNYEATYKVDNTLSTIGYSNDGSFQMSYETNSVRQANQATVTVTNRLSDPIETDASKFTTKGMGILMFTAILMTCSFIALHRLTFKRRRRG